MHRTILVTVEDSEDAAAMCEATAGEWGADMFLCLAGSEGEPEMAFSAGVISEDFAAILPLDEWAINEETQVGTYVRQYPGNAEAVAVASGVDIEDVQDIFDGGIVTSEPWRTTLKRLGLVML